MAKRSLRARLLDIQVAIEELNEILDGSDFANYQKRIATRRGVERCLEIISEASRYIPPELTLHYPDIPWNEVRAIGNQLRHSYQHVDDLVIWKAATNSVPELAQVASEMLAKLSDDK
ncbi:MAG: DUF86 domain-containing protein [Hyphomicrobiaceae bacterium]